MIEVIPKISVLIICYKQEELVKRAINSLLAQKDYIYEICVSDDCSPDRTWEVLQEYDRQYPGLFKLHRNESNVGIFENIEYTWTMPTGDIIYQLSGDDECGEGWFKTVVDYIQKFSIDYRNVPMCILGNYKCNYPNGDSIVYCNNAVRHQLSLVELYLRERISFRSACYSRRILERYVKVSVKKSHISETAMDVQLPLFCDKVFYINQIGNIYYSNIGVSQKVNEEVFQERLKIMPYAEEFLKKQGFSFNGSNKYLTEKNISIKLFRRHRNMINFLRMIKAKILAFDFKYVFISYEIRRYCFAILRRVQHSKPIQFIAE